MKTNKINLTFLFYIYLLNYKEVFEKQIDLEYDINKHKWCMTPNKNQNNFIGEIDYNFLPHKSSWNNMHKVKKIKNDINEIVL